MSDIVWKACRKKLYRHRYTMLEPHEQKRKTQSSNHNAMYARIIKHEVVILLRGLVVHQEQQPGTVDPGKGDLPFFNNHPFFYNFDA